MAKNSEALFLYLNSESINIDKTEVEFQMKSHPDFPSLLSVSDTLDFFNIDSLTARVKFENVDNLPRKFIAYLNTELSKPSLYFIQRIKDDFFYNNGNKLITITKEELEERWTDIILLIEKANNATSLKPEKKISSLVLPLMTVLTFFLLLFRYKEAIASKFFFIFPAIGLLFSVSALKELFGVSSKLLNNFCSITISTDCSSLIKSTKWKIFEIINFSDLSVIFFASQFLSLLFSFISGEVLVYFAIQKILLLTTVPFLFLSLYYQKFVEKKWCPICLVIISIILIETLYLFLFNSSNFYISFNGANIYLLVFMLTVVTWFSLKTVLTKQKELKEFKIEGTRFARNYTLFKNSLLSSDKVNYTELSSGNLIFGNNNAKIRFTVVTNPFCRYCIEVHEILEYLLEKYSENICIDIRFNFDDKNDNELMTEVNNKLIGVYYQDGPLMFLKSMHDWFESKDVSRLPEISNNKEDYKIHEILKEQYLMNLANNISFTPAIIINQYHYPKMYPRRELIYFINDLLEDQDFF